MGRATLTAINCDFINNTSENGGAVNANTSSVFIAINCNFVQNLTKQWWYFS